MARLTLVDIACLWPGWIVVASEANRSKAAAPFVDFKGCFACWLSGLYAIRSLSSRWYVLISFADGAF